jgi:hypothetical protein
VRVVGATSEEQKKGVYLGVIFLRFFLGLGLSLGSFISRMPSARASLRLFFPSNCVELPAQ